MAIDSRSLHKLHYESLQIDCGCNHRRSIKWQNKSLARGYKTEDELCPHNYDDLLPIIRMFKNALLLIDPNIVNEKI